VGTNRCDPRLRQGAILKTDSRLLSWKLPDNQFTVDQKVTLRRILSHSTGLTVSGFAGYVVGEPLPTLIEILDGKPPANSEPIRVDIVPGTKERYSGGGFVLLRQLLIDVTQTPFPALMKKLVLEPAGMRHSTYEQSLPPEWANLAATAHNADGQPLPGKWRIFPEGASDGLWTTPSDLARFAIELRRSWLGEVGQILYPGTAKQMLTQQLGEYGLGIRLSGRGDSARFWHGGSNQGGFECHMVCYEVSGQGAVIMTNAYGEGAWLLWHEILRSIAAEYRWPDERSEIAMLPVP